MRPRFWIAALAMPPSIALAQTPPSPAKVGITSTTVPEVVQVLDNTDTWVTIGTINSATHTFTVVGGGGSVPGGTSGQIQYNNATAFGGFTASGDATINTGTGAVAVTKTGGVAFGALATTVPGTGVATALGVNVGTAGSFVVNGGALGAPSSGTLTNATGLPVAGVSGLGTGVATALAAATDASGGMALVNGAPTVGNCLKWSATGVQDNGAACGGGITLPQTVAGTVTSGGIPYFNSTTQMSSSALLTANALVVGGGAGVTPATLASLGTTTTVLHGNAAGVPTFGAVAISTDVGGLGANVATALGSALNGTGAISATTSPSFVTPVLGTPTSATLTNATGLPIAGVTGWGTGVAAALAIGANTNGGPATATTTSVVVGAINTGGGSGTAPIGLADVAAGSYLKSGGVTTIPAWQAFGTNVQAALAVTLNASGGLAAAAAPLTTGGNVTLSGAFGYYICTGVCTVTLPTPAAGFQFCIRNDSTVVTVITIAAISTVQFEKTTYNGYGTVTTGTMVSGGAVGDKICLVGRDATHYLVGSFVGTWTNS